MDNYDLVPSGLIRLIKQGFNAGVDHAGASIGQPTTFFVGAALNLSAPEPEQEIRNVHRKVRAGADFFLTQPIYRAQDGSALLRRYEAAYGKLGIPILVGVLPLGVVCGVWAIGHSLGEEVANQTGRAIGSR